MILNRKNSIFKTAQSDVKESLIYLKEEEEEKKNRKVCGQALDFFWPEGLRAKRSDESQEDIPSWAENSESRRVASARPPVSGCQHVRRHVLTGAARRK